MRDKHECRICGAEMTYSPNGGWWCDHSARPQIVEANQHHSHDGTTSLVHKQYHEQVVESLRTKIIFLTGVLSAVDEYCQSGLNSSEPKHWEAALQDILKLVRELPEAEKKVKETKT